MLLRMLTEARSKVLHAASDIEKVIILSFLTSLNRTGAITTAQLHQTQTLLHYNLDSENEIARWGGMQLQLLMDARAKLLLTLSDIEKSMSDTDTAIVGNIKN